MFYPLNYGTILAGDGGFEPPSAVLETAMLDHYTNPLCV